LTTLTADLLNALDPSRVMVRAGLRPDPWQRDLLRSSIALRMLVLCARQSGKSTCAAALGLYEALYQPPALVLLLSPSLRQSQELFRATMALYTQGDATVAAVQESALRIEFQNQSRIVALPGESDATIRGYSDVRLLVIDEAARVPDSLYTATRPMLAVSGGRLVCLSTPYGRRGWFRGMDGRRGLAADTD
jgi:phage terminase large subunit-like protein